MIGEFKNPITYMYKEELLKIGWSTSSNTYYTPYIIFKDKHCNSNESCIGVNFEDKQEMFDFMLKEFSCVPIEYTYTGYKDCVGNKIHIRDIVEFDYVFGKQTSPVKKGSMKEDYDINIVGSHISSLRYAFKHSDKIKNIKVIESEHEIEFE